MNMKPRHEKNIVNIVISLNRACNLRCLHCCLNNEYKKNTSVISNEMLEEYFILIEDWIIKQKEKLSSVTILMSGAEIGMIDDDVFKSRADKVYQFFNYLAKKYQSETLSLSMIVLSNLTQISDNKKEWILNKYNESKNNKLEFSLATSFEKHTNRFHSEVIYNRWKDNVKHFLNHNVPTTIVWSVSKQDAIDYESILKEFENIGANIFYVALLPTGETINNPDLFLNYENFSKFLLNIYSYKFQRNLLINQPYIDHFDRVCNFILEQNGYIMIDLLQDQVLYHEKNNTFRFNNEYLKNNTHIEKLENNTETNKIIFNSLWEKYLKTELLRIKEQGCMFCEYFKSCRGGIGTFKPIYHSKDNCSGFKTTLDYFYQSQNDSE